MVRGSITVLFSACVLASATSVAGQGFQSSGIQVVGATNSIAAQLQQQYSRTQAWKRAYRLNPKSACSRGGGNTLCAAASTDAADVYLQLVAATSPWAYSSLDSSQAGTASLVAPPGDQQSCQTCSAFAVAAAAETAIASLLRVRAQDCSISVQALYFCGTPAKSCSAGWDLKSVIDQLQSRAKTLPTAKCLPYNPDFREEFLAGPNCSSSCSTTNPCTSQGTFGSEYISNMWVAQRWIRQFGSVVSQFDVYPDFKPFFEKPGNAKAVYKPKPGAKKLYGHAVVLVGYDNEKKYWLVKNSWGPLWADGGFFRVAYDTCSVLAPGSEAFGIRWTPNSRPKAIRLPVTPVEKNQTCYWYKTRQGDYLSRVAWEASVNLDQLMLDNVDRVKDPDVLVPGTKLLLCNPNPDSLLLPNGVMPKAEPQTDSSYNSDNAKCWEQVGDVKPCDDGYQPFCCDGDGASATCLTANNEDTCTAQHGANFRFGWCKERGC